MIEIVVDQAMCRGDGQCESVRRITSSFATTALLRYYAESREGD